MAIKSIGTLNISVGGVPIPSAAVFPAGPSGPAPWSPPVPWAPATAYVAAAPASAVTIGGGTYICTVAHTSGGSFDPTKFVQIAAQGAPGNPSMVNGHIGPVIDLVASDVGAVAGALLGAENGVATLDNTSHLTASQLPPSPTFESVAVTIGSRELPAPQSGAVFQAASADATITRVELDSFGAASHFSGMRRGATLAAPAALASSNEISSFNGWGYNGAAMVGPAAALRCYAAENWSSGHQGTYWAISVTPIGSTALTDAWYIGSDGGLYANGVTGGSLGTGSINPAVLAEAGIRAATRKRTTVTNQNYTALATDRTVSFTGALTASCTTTLPAASGFPVEQPFWLVDETGLASSTLQLIASPAGSDTIAGLAAGNAGLPAIGTPYGRIALYSNGINLWTYQ